MAESTGNAESPENAEDPGSASSAPGGGGGSSMAVRLLGVAGGLIAVAVAVVAALVLFTDSGSAAPATAMAEHAPADTHLMVALNTDLASGPWLALPDLLERMNVEEDAREEFTQSFEDEGLDYAEDVEPILGVTRGAAVLVQVRDGAFDAAMSAGMSGAAADDSLELVEMVVLFDARDPDRVVELLERWTSTGLPDATRSEERVDDFDLDVIRYEAVSPDDTTLIARRGDLVYVAPRLDHITSLIERREQLGPLSSEPNFGALTGALRHETLLFGYGSARAFSDAGPELGLEELTGELPADLETYSMAFSATATSDGFAGEMLFYGEDGLTGFDGPVNLQADLARAAQSVSDDAQLYIAAPGLRQSLQQALESLDDEAMTAGFGDLREQLLGPIEAESGVDIEADVVDRLDGTWVLAGGIQDLDAMDAFVLFGTESTDADALEQSFQELVDYVNMLCMCNLGIGVGQADGFVRVAWPDTRVAAPTAGETLGDNAAYLQTLDLLPNDPSGIMFLNLSALPPEAVEEMRREAEDFDIESLLGVGFASTQTDNLLHGSMVIPIGGGDQ